MSNLTADQREKLEAAAFRRLVEHLRTHPEAQNIELMNLAGFCRNCLANWYREAADVEGIALTKPESRKIIYGMPYEEWRTLHQKPASPELLAAHDKKHT